MKRVADILFVLLAAPLWLPLIVLTGLAVWARLGRPLLFSQRRAGRDARPFTLWKFRTMLDRRGADGQLLPDRDRLTPFGRWLRASSLDELPELLLVLRGDLSLVGPRPLPVAYTERYTARQRQRLAVRPGITGWAQVNGRNRLGWAERFELDLWYVEHQSLLLDLKILWLTLRTVFRREGISGDGAETMTEFMGSRPDSPPRPNADAPDCQHPSQRSGS